MIGVHWQKISATHQRTFVILVSTEHICSLLLIFQMLTKRDICFRHQGTFMQWAFKQVMFSIHGLGPGALIVGCFVLGGLWLRGFVISCGWP